MSRRRHVFVLRLGDAEHADLQSRADAEGIAKADVVRKALGWEVEGLIKPASERRPPRRRRRSKPKPVEDPDRGPGERSLDELMRRLGRS